jgi:AcrR family transcriptional regulator
MSSPEPNPDDSSLQGENLDYTEHLAREVQRAEGLNKGERTKLVIRAAAARILAREGYHDLRMADIAQEAGLSHGAVYRYYDNKRDVTFEVLRVQSDWALELLLPEARSKSAYGRIYASTRRYVDLFRANIGLMRCLRQLGDEYPEFDQIVMENNRRWYRQVASGLAHRAGKSDAARKQAFGVASALGGMVDEMMHNVFVREDPTLAHFRREPGTLAKVLAILWYRAAYARNPRASEIGEDHPLLDLKAGRRRR